MQGRLGKERPGERDQGTLMQPSWEGRERKGIGVESRQQNQQGSEIQRMLVRLPSISGPALERTFLKMPCGFLFFSFFWLHWVFVAARWLSLVVASGDYSSLWCAGFSLRWLLLLQGMGSRRVDFSSCGPQAPECRLSSCGSRALEHRLSSCGARA